MIPFNIPCFTGREMENLKEVINLKKFAGDGRFTSKCHQWLENLTGCAKSLLTTSCTHALEMTAILADIKPGDEVIMPSFTFVSTANAFVLRGAKVIFIDIRPDTMNMDENLIEEAVSERTKVIVPVHYAGISCEMDKITEIAQKHNLLVIEDSAQGVYSKYKGKSLGSIGDFGCYSFHETKNYTCGEGGALLIRNKSFKERAEIIREKGTNRSKFWRGEVDKYTWVDVGSSYLPSEINAAFLFTQLEAAAQINDKRKAIWDRYFELLSPLKAKGRLELPFVPSYCESNAHLFYIKTASLSERTDLIAYLKEKEIQAVFHYIPLHTSPAGKLFGKFIGKDQWTTKESERLLRLPLYYNMDIASVEIVAEAVKKFYD